ncbi:MAG: phosphoribosyltransferase family protein [Balneolales bacterium]
MEYRSFADLSTTIAMNLHKIPHDVDLIVGIPRGGLLAGNMIALQLNIPLVDLDGYIENTRLHWGAIQTTRARIYFPREAKHVLIVDDTIYAGKSMAHAKALIKNASVDHRTTSCTVYANPGSLDLIDIYFEKLTSPGCQEWNIMHRDKLEHFCVDIDGVVCKDPLKKDDDDGPAYLDFLKNAEPLMLPSRKVGCLVTGRLEKYRKETEYWLSKHNIQYHELHMLDLPDAKTRWKLRAAPIFKAKVYKSYPNSPLFIESDHAEALKISRLSGRDVLCFSSQQLIKQGFSVERIELAVKSYRKHTLRKARKIIRKALRHEKL